MTNNAGKTQTQGLRRTRHTCTHSNVPKHHVLSQINTFLNLKLVAGAHLSTLPYQIPPMLLPFFYHYLYNKPIWSVLVSLECSVACLSSSCACRLRPKSSELLLSKIRMARPECLSAFVSMFVERGLISFQEVWPLSLAHHLHLKGDIRWTDIIHKSALQGPLKSKLQ